VIQPNLQHNIYSKKCDMIFLVDETGFRPAIYYIATTPTIQEFGTKVLGQQQKHAQNKRNEDNGEATKR
jgi:hypothetical protein